MNKIEQEQYRNGLKVNEPLSQEYMDACANDYNIKKRQELLEQGVNWDLKSPLFFSAKELDDWKKEKKRRSTLLKRK